MHKIRVYEAAPADLIRRAEPRSASVSKLERVNSIMVSLDSRAEPPSVAKLENTAQYFGQS